MSKGEDKGLERLWSGITQRKEPPKADKVLPMERPPAATRTPPDRSYVAFILRPRAKRLEIQRAHASSRFPAYAYLLDMDYDPDYDSAFSLIYTFGVVIVTGRNVGEIVYAIDDGKCKRITQFNPKKHDKPDPGESLIESVEIVMADEQLTKAGRKP